MLLLPCDEMLGSDEIDLSSKTLGLEPILVQCRG